MRNVIDKKRIAFIGLGAMGKPMVHNLMEAGFCVSVFDISSEAIDACSDYKIGRAHV